MKSLLQIYQLTNSHQLTPTHTNSHQLTPTYLATQTWIRVYFYR